LIIYLQKENKSETELYKHHDKKLLIIILISSRTPEEMTWQQNTVYYQITLFIGWQLRLIRPMDAARLSPGKRSAARQNSAL